MNDFHKQRYEELEKKYVEMFKCFLHDPGDINMAQNMIHDIIQATLEISKSRPNKELKGNFFAPLPDYGDLMTLEAFQEACKSGGFIDYDGEGHPVGVESGTYVPPNAPFLKGHLRMDPNVTVCASECDDVPEGTTHVVWFNR